jgi:hypothetical protein
MRKKIDRHGMKYTSIQMYEDTYKLVNRHKNIGESMNTAINRIIIEYEKMKNREV